VRTPHNIRNYRKIYWVQGLESEESYLKHNRLTRRLALAFTESLAMRACRVIICPSDAMIETLLHRYPFLHQNAFMTIPNLADSDPVPARDSSLWGFEKHPRFALGYVGGLSRWQCFEESSRIVAEVQNQIPDTWFLVLTRDKEQAEDVLKRVGIEQYRIRSTTTEQVPRYVVSFDLGLMLRRDHIVNRVSCPVKWLEYWRCGVPIVTTRAVRIVTDSPGIEFNCLVDIDDFSAAAKQVMAWASLPEGERQRVRVAVASCVERDWTWLQGQGAIEEVFTALECSPGPRRYLWRDRLVAHAFRHLQQAKKARPFEPAV
jgi:glycosyltransferase involved in cell wall biosynthesis